MASQRVSLSNRLTVSHEERLNTLVNELIADCRTPEQLLDANGSLKPMTRQLVEGMLASEIYRQN